MVAHGHKLMLRSVVTLSNEKFRYRVNVLCVVYIACHVNRDVYETNYPRQCFKDSSVKYLLKMWCS
jgi:hypothetical protein